MKKLLILILALSLGAAATAGAVPIFTETFDSGLNGWTVNNNNSDDYTWEHNKNGSWNFTGGSGGFALADSYMSWADNWYDTLVSPIIDLAGAASVTVGAAISYEHDIEGGYADISYSLDQGATWRSIEEWSATFQGKKSWDLVLDTGAQTLQLAFEYYLPEWSNYSFQVDDVTISDNGSPVPVPGAFWLLGTGLACLAGLRRKQG